MTCNEFINKNTCRPYIHFFSIASSCKHFRCSIVQSASNSKHLEFGASHAVFPTDSVIDQFNLFVYWIIEYILSLDVPVADCSLV